jgi:hypothetical protein
MSKHVTFYTASDRFDRRSALYTSIKRLTDGGEHVHLIGRKLGRLYWNCDCTEVKK